MAENLANIILFDWFSITSKCDSADSIKLLLGMGDVPWQLTTGMHGYRSRYYFESISIHFDGNNNTVWLEMSGQGCRAFETYSDHSDWFKLFDLVLHDPDNYHITRLDVAYDDWTGVLNIKTLNRYSRERCLVSKFRDYGVDQSYVKDDICLYYGSKKSDVLFRCYNKAAERNREDVKHWVRFEMQLRDERALAFLQNFEMLDRNIGMCFMGVLNNYLRFVKPSADTNKARWDTAPFWLRFVSCVERISLFTKKDVEYNYSQLKNYVLNQAGNAVDCLISIDGIDKFYEDLKHREANPNPKYSSLLDSILMDRVHNGEGVAF